MEIEYNKKLWSTSEGSVIVYWKFPNLGLKKPVRDYSRLIHPTRRMKAC